MTSSVKHLPAVAYVGNPRLQPALVEIVFLGGSERRPLPARLDLENKSPTGFAWGYCGSGAAQLALAILADWFARTTQNGGFADRLALRLFQPFKETYVAGLTGDAPWNLSGPELAQKLCELVTHRGLWKDLYAWVENDVCATVEAESHEAMVRCIALARDQLTRAFCLATPVEA